MQRAGKASLLLYFIHVPVAELVRLLTPRVWGPAGAMPMFAISFAASLTAAFLLQPYYDALTARINMAAWKQPTPVLAHR
jgi:peptidoglycan/LPS O-acetylase OafA/YrhL